MHIAIDAHVVGEQETGNETYTLNLIRALLRVTSRDPKGFSWDAGPGSETGSGRVTPRRFGAVPRFLLLTPHPERLAAALPELPPHAAIKPVAPANALLRIPLGLPISALRNAFDLLHVNYNAPPFAPCPTVVTIHDIAFEHYPEFFSPRDLLILKTLVPLSARRAARVITVSQHARDEILARYGLPADKVVVTYEAAGEQFQPVADPAARQAVRDRLGIGQAPFVLALGNLQPRKNMVRLVEAFHRVVPATAPDLRLVIAGQAQWRESEVYRAVSTSGLAERVLFPGYIAAADLPALYSAASVFVYPSLYEGFGLPPLEAMACGTPVVCSDAASLPEIVGTAALLCDPLDVDALAAAIAAVLQDPDQAAELRRRGLARAAQFSWDRCAMETLAVYGAARAAARPGEVEPQV